MPTEPEPDYNGPDDPDGELFTCWCGAIGTYEEMFDDDCLEEGCGGTRTLHCECGGDHLCVCHHHGECECPGCPDCESEDDDYGPSDED